MKKAVYSSNAPEAIGPYSQGIKAGSLLFLSGQLPIDPKTGLLKEGIQEQTTQVLNNISAILESEQLTINDVLKTTVFLKNLSDFSAMNEIYAKFFAEPYPSRSTVEVAALPKNALVEIECIAIKN
ncbi:MAG: RidA family protein [Christensenellaceae bacterium]|jgi:2-iminobutanoate/2-iminopropanoate deaminase|nr:RidA family protein [Christensenellaceae bacterium]